MASVEEMKLFLGVLYDNTDWEQKVAKMSDKQVMAIYLNVIGKKKKKIKIDIPTTPIYEPPEQYKNHKWVSVDTLNKDRGVVTSF